MTTFTVSIQTYDSVVDIEKTMGLGDDLDTMMIAMGDALSAAGYDIDPRLIQMKDHWALINKTEPFDFTPYMKNQDEAVGCMGDPDGTPGDIWDEWFGGTDTIAEEQAVKPVEFLVGDIVKVARKDLVDDFAVHGQIGRVSDVKSWNYIQTVHVMFQEGEYRSWHCAPADLDLIYRP